MDKYLCAAGKGEVTSEECLNCALVGNNVCGFEYSMLSKMLAPDLRQGIHVSDLTGCLRKAYYGQMGHEAPEYIHHKMATFIGKGVHHYLEDQFDEHFVTELKVSGWGVVGTADVVYKDGGLIDYKTVRKLDKYFLPNPSHVRQLNIYAAMLEAKGRSVERLAIQYISTDGPSRCPNCKRMVVPGGEHGYQCPKCGRSKVSYHPGVFLIPIPKMGQEEVRQMIEEKVAELQACIDLQSPPKGEPSWVCDFCKFKEGCPDREQNEQD